MIKNIVTRELKPEDLHFMPSGNRSIKPALVKKMKDSVATYGILRAVVVVRTNLFNDGLNYYIADGQHLFMACESLNVLSQLPIIVVKRKFEHIQSLIEFISILNVTQSPWKLADYIGAYAATNVFISYNKLIAKKAEYDLTYSALSVIYSGESKPTASTKIKAGQFRVVNEPKSDNIAAYIKDLVPLFGRSNSTALINLAHIMFHWYDKSSYNHAKFRKFITLHLHPFSTSTEAEMRGLIEKYDKQYVHQNS